jgi:hypothetical protein
MIDVGNEEKLLEAVDRYKLGQNQPNDELYTLWRNSSYSTAL